MLTKAHCFTFEAPGRLSVLSTEALVRSSLAGEDKKTFRALAIWDTGATGSVITQEIVTACGLKPIGMVNTHTVNGVRASEVFLVEVKLPNGVVIHQVRVTVGDMGEGGPQMLIGMDIIGLGDFAITNLGGKTVFTFRVPSMERIDFLKSAKQSIGRNDPCPCGSGNKYKKCHGNGK